MGVTVGRQLIKNRASVGQPGTVNRIALMDVDLSVLEQLQGGAASSTIYRTLRLSRHDFEESRLRLRRYLYKYKHRLQIESY